MRHQIMTAVIACAVFSAITARHVSAEETQASAGEELQTRVYQVADLMHFQAQSASPEKSLENLVALIRANAAAGSWNSETSGMILSHPSTLSVVIRQTRKNHSEVASFITNLRKLQSDRQISVEVRCMDVSQELGKEWVAERLLDEESAAKRRDELASHKETVTRFAPKITLFPSQAGSIEFSPATGQIQSADAKSVSDNVEFAFRATESADQQSVELLFSFHDADAETLDIFRTTTSHVIPKGHTLVIPVLTKEQQTNPLMNPAFLAKNGIKPGTATEQPGLLLWITPTVIESKEKEDALLGQK